MSLARSIRITGFMGALAAVAALTGCGKGSATTGTPAASASSGGSGGSSTGATGQVNLAITDAPTDAWEQVSVQLLSASLLAQGSQTPVPIWTASAASPTVVNLVDLNSVATLLGALQVPVGTYSTLQLVINPDPSTMTLVDDNGNSIPASAITVAGSATLNVTLAPALVVSGTGAVTVQADFNLADPLSISEVTLGGVPQVTVNLQVGPKPLPGNVASQQFTRKLGQVTATTASGFTITDSAGATFSFGVDANTIYADADTQAPGAFTGLTDGAYALVAANLNADGSFYARRVWYAASAATLPTRTPEGLVRRVNVQNNSFTIYAPAAASSSAASGPAWAAQTVAVDANTVWTYNTSVAMGTGTGFLADIWRGCRVDVVLNNAGTTATAVNVEHACDEGFIGSASGSALTFGMPALPGPPPPMPAGVSNGINDLAARSYDYAAASFAWWYFGLPSSADSAPADLVTVVTAAEAAMLPVAAFANLTWDPAASAWQVSQLILEPEPLHLSVITTAYVDGGSGSGTMAVTCLNPMNNFDASTPTPLTITLDYQGDLQTVVSSTDLDSASNVITYLAPVPEASWAALLVPPAAPELSATQISVRPVIAGSTVAWHAYSVACFTGTAPARPTITSFSATPGTIQAGAAAALSAVFSNGTGVINPGSLPVTSGTPVSVSPTASTRYVLTVTDSQGQSLCQGLQVNVGSANPAPTITAFTGQPATIPVGAKAFLLGIFDGGRGVITPGNLPAMSGLPVPVSPSASTPYTLTVTNPTGTAVTQTTTITVQAAPPAPAITSFTASPASITAGSTATLTGLFSNGQGLITPGHIPVPTSGLAITVKPPVTTTFTLTVTNPAGQPQTLSATVTVTPASNAN